MKKNNIIRKDKSFWVLILSIAVIFCYGLFHSISKKNQLKDNPSYTTGQIVKKYKILKRGYYVHYKYIVNKRVFEGSQKLSIDQKSVKIGDVFEVVYSLENPDYSELLFDKKIEKQ